MKSKLVCRLAIPLIFIASSTFGQLKNISVSIGANYPFINGTSRSFVANNHLPSTIGYYSPQVMRIQHSHESRIGISGGSTFDFSVSNIIISTGLQVSYLRFNVLNR